MVKQKQTFTRNGIETMFANINTQSGIITLGLVYKLSVDIRTEKFFVALEEIISSLDPNIKLILLVTLT